MALYETVFIARQDITAQQVDTLADQFTEVIGQNGGSIQKREYWGLRNLTYRIKKNRKGHYMLFNIDAPAAAVIEMERTMRINEDVLRYQSLRVEALEEGASPIMQAKGKSDARREREPMGYEGYEA
jgi:small subunit ribosomal protein S6